MKNSLQQTGPWMPALVPLPELDQSAVPYITYLVTLNGRPVAV